jgi:hypothetical protein
MFERLTREKEDLIKLQSYTLKSKETLLEEKQHRMI